MYLYCTCYAERSVGLLVPRYSGGPMTERYVYNYVDKTPASLVGASIYIVGR